MLGVSEDGSTDLLMGHKDKLFETFDLIPYFAEIEFFGLPLAR
jgi:hypothetical protein